MLPGNGGDGLLQSTYMLVLTHIATMRRRQTPSPFLPSPSLPCPALHHLAFEHVEWMLLDSSDARPSPFRRRPASF